MCESMDKNRIQGVSVGRAGNLPRSPYPSKMRSVDPAAAHGRRLSLPQEICSASLTRGEDAWSRLSRISRTVVLRRWSRLRMSKGGLTAEQKSAEGILGHVVGKASEALRGR